MTVPLDVKLVWCAFAGTILGACIALAPAVAVAGIVGIGPVLYTALRLGRVLSL